MSWHVVARVAANIAKKKLADKVTSQKNGSVLWRAVITGGIVTAPLVMVLVIIMLGATALVVTSPAAAAGAALGIPPVVFSAYLAAETNAASVAPDCVVDWPVIAGIWKVESGHANGRTITAAGVVTPPIYGVTLDGSQPGTAVLSDTDGGLIDADPIWDRAVGPAQFLPRSWRAFGQDGNADGVADPHNIFDAALGTVAHLCLASPGDYNDPVDLARALRRYNNSAVYVTTVSGWIDYYRSFQFTRGAVTADGLYAFPLPHESVTVEVIRSTHHDYPASDLGVPEGTPVFAAHPGTVTAISAPCADTQRCRCGWGVHIAGHDNHTYTYCHGTAVNVAAGTEVTAGALIMTSGNTGNSRGAHLHFQIRNPAGVLICPQTLLGAWHQGIGVSPATAPTSGCTH